MSNHYILSVTGNNGQPGRPWERSLPSRGIVLLKTAQPEKIRTYCDAYPLLLVLVDIAPDQDGVVGRISEIHRLLRELSVAAPLIGILSHPVSPEQRIELAEAGIEGLIHSDDPDQFLLAQVNLLTRLRDLQQFEQSKLDVNDLAHRTRESLHDLSQPLSAIHGRLQLLASRCPADDPNAECFQELVRLTFDLTQQVMQMQQMHRRYS